MASTAPDTGEDRYVEGADGTKVPWNAVQFDKSGASESPVTQARLVAQASEGITDCFVFSHGWNNDWDRALALYEDFITGYLALKNQYGLELDRPFRPLLIGIFWPSTSLVMPWEQGPDIAAAEPGASSTPEQEDLDALGELLDDQDRARLGELAELDRDLHREEAEAVARMLAPLIGGEDEVDDREGPTEAELAELFYAPPAEDDYDDSGLYGTFVPTGKVGGALRDALRMTTVRIMKDRAGVVGANGVGPLVRDLAAAGDNVRVHLVGHSYGCKVVLSAMAATDTTVESMLLLQPAVSRLCFAQDTGAGRPGGYRVVLDRVHQPILITFSDNDIPLRKFFHLALRREEDLGEVTIAAGEPSRYAALGGYGPGGCGAECETVDMKAANDWYRLDRDDVELVALRGDDYIDGHGDVSNESTWWALHNLLVAPA